VKRYGEITEKQREAATACRSTLATILKQRREHREALKQAVLTGKAEPKTPDETDLFTIAREQYRRTLAMADARQEAEHTLRADLADATDALAALHEQEWQTAEEVREMQQKVDVVLAVFAEHRSVAQWLARFQSNDRMGRSNSVYDRPKPVAATVNEVDLSLIEKGLAREEAAS
jgi:hypothetical protein